MKVGFDIDGVILDIDLGLIRMIDHMDSEEARKEVSKFYYALRRRQLNPIDFLHDDDELYFITSRSEEYQEVTERWAKKYFPQAKLIVLGHAEPTKESKLDSWFVRAAKKKAKAINENKIDVYFEDTGPVVKILRELCTNTKIIQYGGRFDL